MIKYIWMVMLAAAVIYWMIYTIADTINTFKKDRYHFGFRYLESISQAFYIAVPSFIFFYSLYSYLLQ